MTITLVQGNGSTQNHFTGSGSTTLSGTLYATPTSGNLLIVGIATVGSFGNTYLVQSINESGVTWTKILQNNGVQYSPQYDVELWAGVVGSSPSASFTITISNSANIIADFFEYSGLATSSYTDKTASNSAPTGGNTAGDTGTTATTTMASELWFGVLEASYPSSVGSASNGFTLYDGSVAYCTCVILTKIVSAEGTTDSGVTFGQSTSWNGCIATFFASSGATNINVSDVSNTTVDALYSLTAALPVADASNSGVDLFSSSAAIPSNDASNTTVDAASSTAQIPASDASNSGADAITARGIGLADASNAAVEVSSSIANIPVNDASNVTVDSTSISVTFAISDASNLTSDSVVVSAPGVVSVSDASNLSVDSIAITVTVNFADASNATVDAASIQALLSLLDQSNTTADVAAVLLKLQDSSVASDLASLIAQISVSDASTSVDVSVLQALLSLLDSSVAVDAAQLNALLQLNDASASSDQAKIVTALLQLLTRSVTLRGDGVPVVLRGDGAPVVAE